MTQNVTDRRKNISIYVDGSGPKPGEYAGKVGLYAVITYYTTATPGYGSSSTALPTQNSEQRQYPGGRTNNQSELIAILKALEFLNDYTDDWDEAVILSDSQLAVNAVNRHWKLKDPELIEINNKIQNLLRSVNNVSIEWIPRYLNTKADALTR